MHVGDNLLGSHYIPDTVAGKYNKFSVTGDRHGLDIGASGDSLVFGLAKVVVLVLEVTEGSGESQHAVDSAILDEALGVVNAAGLFLVVRLVVLGELDSRATLAHDGTRVASVGANDLSRGHKDGGCRASGEGLATVLGIEVITGSILLRD